jgi:hypothetical protein
LNAAAGLCGEIRHRWLAACGIPDDEPPAPLLNHPA